MHAMHDHMENYKIKILINLCFEKKQKNNCIDYLNLSGPIAINVSSIIGRLLRVAAFIHATITISNKRPINKFICN